MTKEAKLAALDTLASLPVATDVEEEAAHIIECGLLHSNIPTCCVTWFLYGGSKWTEEQRKAYDDMEEDLFAGNYSPCPTCFTKFLKTGSFRKIKRCDCECPCCGCERHRSAEGLCRHGKTSHD